MTPDDIVEIANNAGANVHFVRHHIFFIKEFAKLVAEREREQCALICDTEWGTSDEQAAGVMFSKEIRARGEK